MQVDVFYLIVTSALRSRTTPKSSLGLYTKIGPYKNVKCAKKTLHSETAPTEGTAVHADQNALKIITTGPQAHRSACKISHGADFTGAIAPTVMKGGAEIASAGKCMYGKCKYWKRKYTCKSINQINQTLLWNVTNAHKTLKVQWEWQCRKTKKTKHVNTNILAN